MPNVTGGIDHPVVTIRDFDTVRQQYESLGFSPSPVGYHPWGTVMSLMMFKENFIELISVHDASKFGTNSVNGFCYGRNVGHFLDREEGLGLVALHSKDSRADHARLTARGVPSQGLIDFRRDTKKADGTPDVAVVSLGLFLNEQQRDVSNFICHQHRPELIWRPEWMHHSNGVTAISAVTYVAENPRELQARYEAFYGIDRVKADSDRVEADSGCGSIRIVSPEFAGQLYRGVPLPKWSDTDAPHGISITLTTDCLDQLPKLWEGRGLGEVWTSRGTLTVPPDRCGNVLLEFEPAG